MLAARAELKRNLQRECKNKFPVLGKSQVIKWARAAKAELWAELPEVVRKKQGATTNEWRSKIEGIPPKGRPLGGQIPMSTTERARCSYLRNVDGTIRCVRKT